MILVISFPEWKKKVAKLQPDKTVSFAENAEPKWPDLMPFLPAFPGGEIDLNNCLLRKLKIFLSQILLKVNGGNRWGIEAFREGSLCRSN